MYYVDFIHLYDYTYITYVTLCLYLNTTNYMYVDQFVICKWNIHLELSHYCRRRNRFKLPTKGRDFGMVTLSSHE